MRTFSALDLIQAHEWSNAFFTTYALSLSFFEAVILDGLVRQNVERTLVLADVVGVSAAVAEYGSRCAGRVYEIEPVVVERGCFHPKFMALTSSTEAHLVVGSGNLTFGGWGANLECVEHLHPGVASEAFDDAADFLESLSKVPWVKHFAQKQCRSLSERFRLSAGAGVRTGAIRLLHSLERPLLEQLAEIAEELGGARRLTLAAPFHDGVALDRVCRRLRLDHAFVHSHPAGTVAGSFGANWPTGASVTVGPVAVALFADDGRRLHAKAFEVICRRGRLVMSGSANATLAALDRERNVELCVVRIQRNPLVAWHVTPCSAPAPIGQAPSEESIEPREGVLRAILEGDELKGWILTPFPQGNATVSRLTASGWLAIDKVVVEEGGRFSLVAREVEREAWTAHRLILQVKSRTGEVADGFVSFADFAEINRHLGSISSRLFALLAGTETPDDVAAVMSWFHEHPEYLSPHHGAGGRQPHRAVSGEVSVSGLLDPDTIDTGVAHPRASSGAAPWRRFIALVLESFQERRGPIHSDDQPDDASGESDRAEDRVAGEPTLERDFERPLSFFERLLDQMLAGSASNHIRAFWLTHYVCDRLEPDEVRVESYLSKVLNRIAEPPEAADRDAVAGAVLVLFEYRRDQASSPLVVASNARRALLRAGVDLAGSVPDMSLVKGFVRILAPDLDFRRFWNEICDVRTAQEEIMSYRLSGAAAPPGPEFPHLSRELGNINEAARKRMIFMPRYSEYCPHCRYRLPAVQRSSLRDSGVVRADCCGRLLLCEEV